MVIFLLGLIIGMIIREMKVSTMRTIEKTKQLLPHEKVSFYESMSNKEKFDNAKNIGDLLS